MSILYILETSDKVDILDHVKETFDIMEYPTPIIFSSIARLSIISFLRGRGDVDDIDIASVAVDIFRQLSEYSTKDEQYKWFDQWAFKMIKTSKERRVRIG